MSERCLRFCAQNTFVLFFILKGFLYLVLERKGGRKGEKHQCVVASHTPWGLDHNPGVWPDWESNW